MFGKAALQRAALAISRISPTTWVLLCAAAQATVALVLVTLHVVLRGNGSLLGVLGNAASVTSVVILAAGIVLRRRRLVLAHAALSFLSTPVQMVPVGFTMQHMASRSVAGGLLVVGLGILSGLLSTLAALLSPFIADRVSLRLAAQRLQNETLSIVMDLNPIPLDPCESRSNRATVVQPTTLLTATPHNAGALCSPLLEANVSLSSSPATHSDTASQNSGAVTHACSPRACVTRRTATGFGPAIAVPAGAAQ